MSQGIPLTANLQQGPPGYDAPMHPAPVPLAQVPVPLELEHVCTAETTDGNPEQVEAERPNSPDPAPQAASAPLTPHEGFAPPMAPLSAPPESPASLSEALANRSPLVLDKLLSQDPHYL